MTSDTSIDERLFQASRTGDLDSVCALLKDGADPGCSQSDDAGAPWHDLDAEGYSAGDYASGNRHTQVFRQLLDWAVRAELILGAAARHAASASRPEPSEQGYLAEGVCYREGQLVDSEGEAVMMDWEAPLMKEHARIICGEHPQTARVLNVGFGMGIVDSYIAERQPAQHVIIEAHPDVLTHMRKEGWHDKPGVTVVPGKWQDVIDQLGPFDGIFFDTYGEYAEDMREFHQHLPRLLVPGGVYSFFNGLCPDNIFFNMVQSEVVKLELARLGLQTEYRPMPMDASADSIWEGIKNRYWHLPVYMLPTCTRVAAEEQE